MTAVDMPAPHAFDLLGELPSGTTVLEASAGTGKTFTIAALVARYIAEGRAAMEDLLVVSFSREATRELRERVRERLVGTRDGLAAAASGRPVPQPDAVLAHILDVAPDELDRRATRLSEALAGFDSATVTTTHGFSHQVLAALGTASDHDAGAVLLERRDDLVDEVADDLFLRKWGPPGAPPPELSRDEFRQLARSVVQDPATRLLPEPRVGGLPGTRARIAAAVRQEVDVRKRRQHLLDYDDMLLRLRATLTDPSSGPDARARLRRRYSVVLVDEFQDTDPVQWAILREAFHGFRTLVLIGDPKQAIYRFRGADVHAYLSAVESAVSVSTLPTNWRSDALLLDGLAAVLHGAALGDERIRVLPVTAAHSGRMVATPGTERPPVRLRVVPRDDRPLTGKGLLGTADARRIVVADLAVEVVEELRTARVTPREGGPQRPLQPGDIAVLTRRVKEAQQVEAALREAGVPVVVSSRSSVFATQAAAEWQLLLEAMEQPHRATRVRRFALGCFVGLSAADLVGPGAGDTDALSLRLRAWSGVLAERGVAALFEAVSLAQDLQPRILEQPDGERLLTDLRHVAESLHQASLDAHLGLAALLPWLRRRIREAGTEEARERSRRLESDAAAVQVITVHASKGLEFPVVMVPFAWSQWSPESPSTVVFHEGGERLRDVGGTGSPDWAAHAAAHHREEIDDELRLAYVALTRAQGQLVVWWAPTSNTPTSPLHRLLFHSGAEVAPAAVSVPSDALAVEAFRSRAAASGGVLGVEVVHTRPPVRWSPSPGAPPVLEAARFERRLDEGWRRTSYSALTAAAHELRLGSEPETPQTEDERDVEQPAADVAAASADRELRDVPSLWHELQGGTGFGTLVHAVLETAGDLSDEAAVRGAVAAQAGRLGPGTDVDALSAALLRALETPLGPLADGRTLAEVGAADRLPELDFELPLSGGDAPGPARVVLADLVPLWREHGGGRLADYADALSALEPAPLRGYLTGSIDAVLRVGPPESRRYVVVDYKTNRLAGREERLTAWHYRQHAMHDAMVEAHYPLQALLYEVALHRYLRWRVPDYDPEQHLGGALYLFLRGMSGPGVVESDGGVPGVFDWRPPAKLVVATSDLLAGAR